MVKCESGRVKRRAPPADEQNRSKGSKTQAGSAAGRAWTQHVAQRRLNRFKSFTVGDRRHR